MYTIHKHIYTVFGQLKKMSIEFNLSILHGLLCLKVLIFISSNLCKTIAKEFLRKKYLYYKTFF